ncbi:MAG TPA: hypothetical protein VMV15_00945 [Candidatus Binataceae bacterium]|nr:hypothetical protein [Candidatus Binataceae bacterium]
MSSQEPPQDTDREESAAESEDRDHSVASKLSEELSNWRRRRHTGGGRQRSAEDGGSGGSFQSDSARTIKVRGHETLVIRKPKSASPRRASPEPSDR